MHSVPSTFIPAFLWVSCIFVGCKQQYMLYKDHKFHFQKKMFLRCAMIITTLYHHALSLLHKKWWVFSISVYSARCKSCLCMQVWCYFYGLPVCVLHVCATVHTLHSKACFLFDSYLQQLFICVCFWNRKRRMFRVNCTKISLFVCVINYWPLKLV